jgi:hypothetical protein
MSNLTEINNLPEDIYKNIILFYIGKKKATIPSSAILFFALSEEGRVYFYLTLARKRGEKGEKKKL